MTTHTIHSHANGQICSDPYCDHQYTSKKLEKTVWIRFQELVGNIKDDLAEVFYSNIDPEPRFNNSGTRAVIRPDRIDLIKSN
jgi:hypothetical protein